VEGQRRQLVCSGQTSVDADGNPQHPGDMGAQINLALGNLGAVLAQAGTTFANLVRPTHTRRMSTRSSPEAFDHRCSAAEAGSGPEAPSARTPHRDSDRRAGLRVMPMPIPVHRRVARPTPAANTGAAIRWHGVTVRFTANSGSSRASPVGPRGAQRPVAQSAFGGLAGTLASTLGDI
jgi:Endoribonuclease L-PSP